jgi:hypothetical protein
MAHVLEEGVLVGASGWAIKCGDRKGCHAVPKHDHRNEGVSTMPTLVGTMAQLALGGLFLYLLFFFLSSSSKMEEGL